MGLSFAFIASVTSLENGDRGSGIGEEPATCHLPHFHLLWWAAAHANSLLFTIFG
jgi:hypothetical protein